MADHRVHCEIVVPKGMQEGIPIDALRVIQDGGNEFLLEFFQWPKESPKAALVDRIRVHREALWAMWDRLDSSVKPPRVMMFAPAATWRKPNGD